MKILARYLILAAFLVSQAAMALSTIEFMKMDNLQQFKVVQPLMIGFLQNGYKHVPDNEFKLVAEIKRLAFEKGYTYQNVEDVAKEAAINLGMTR